MTRHGWGSLFVLFVLKGDAGHTPVVAVSTFTKYGVGFGGWVALGIETAHVVLVAVQGKKTGVGDLGTVRSDTVVVEAPALEAQSSLILSFYVRRFGCWIFTFSPVTIGVGPGVSVVRKFEATVDLYAFCSRSLVYLGIGWKYVSHPTSIEFVG